MSLRRNKICITLFGLLFFSLHAPLHMQAAEMITLDRALKIALKKNPSLAASQSEVNIAQHRVTQAFADYYPQLSASSGYDRTRTYYETSQTNTGIMSNTNTGNIENNISTGLSVSQYLYDFGKTPAQVEKSRKSKESIEKGLETVEKTLVRDVKQAFFEVLKNQQLVFVSRENLEFRKQQLEQARALYKTGMRPKIDITRGEVETSKARLSLVVSEYGLQESIIAFEKLLGGPPVSGEYILEEEDSHVMPSPPLKNLVEDALDSRPEMAALKAQVDSAEAGLLSAKRSYFPSLKANGSYAYSGEELPLEDRRWQIGVNLSWPLFTGFRQSSQVKEAKEEVTRLNAQLASRRLLVTEEVTRAYFQLRTAQETIKNAETALRQAKENLSIAQGSYKAGVSDSIELSDAQVLYTESRSELVQALYDSHRARAGLEFAVGGQISSE